MKPVLPNAEPIRATLRPLNLALHEVEVELALPAPLAALGPVMALPAWTPGSYLVRDYARFLDRVRLVDALGIPHPVEKLDKQRWKLPSLSGEARLTYRLFCNDLTVRTNHADAAHAHFVGAATFLFPEAEPGRPYDVGFKGFPKTWKIATALPKSGGRYRAADYDTLVDSPFELGTFRLHRWDSAGAAFEFAITGEHPGDEGRMVEGTQRIVAVCSELFQGFPFERYVFLLTFSPGLRGGLEHRESTSLIADPFRLDSPEGYAELFTLIAHEFFHAWNVKRMRAPGLGPFDYTGENYTRLLWFHEGFTNFLQYILALRAGLVPWAWAAQKLSQSWTDNTTRAGRREQSLEESSWDAWIRHYKPTEFSANSTVNYYDKGSLVAWMMDAQIRLGSRGRHGLEALFRWLWQRVGDGTVTDEILREGFESLSGQPAGPFWSAWILGCEELDACSIQRAYGLRFDWRAPWDELSPEEAADPSSMAKAKGYVGLTFGNGSPVVQNVMPGSPAAEAGLGYGDEIVAVQGWRTVSAAEAQKRFREIEVGREVNVLAASRGRVGARTFRVVENPTRLVRIVADSKAGVAQRKAFLALTGMEHPTPAKGGR